MEGNEVRRLREKITDLSELFDQEIVTAFAEGRNRKDGIADTVDFSYVVNGAGSIGKAKFFELIESYNVNVRDDAQLKKLAIELTHLGKTLGENYEELQQSKKRAEFEVILDEMKSKISSSPFMQELSPEEMAQRMEMLDIVFDEDGEPRRGETLKRVNAFLIRLENESYAVRGARMMNRDPELLEMYEDLRGMEEDLVKEQEYRREQRVLMTKYTSLCTAYQILEDVESELSNPKLIDRRKTELEKARTAVLESLKATMSPDVSERLFGENGDKNPKMYQVMRALKGDIEDVAFQVNAANGIVDKDVLARDVFDIVKFDRMNEMEAASAIKDSKTRNEKISELAKTKDLETFAKKLELQRMLEELKELLLKLEDLKVAEARYNELKAKPEKDLTDAEKQELGELIKKHMALKTVKGQITTLQTSIKALAQELHMGSFEKMNLNSAHAVGKFGLGDVKKSIDGQKKYAQIKRNEVCDKYGVDKNETTENIGAQIKAKVVEIESRKRKKIVEPEGPGSNGVNAPGNPGTQNIGNPSMPGHGTPTPLNFGGRPTPTSVPSSSFGNGPRYGNTSIPTLMPQSQEAPGVAPTEKSENNQVQAPTDPMLDPNSLESRLAFLTNSAGKVVETLVVEDAELQINTIEPEHKQRVENGIVYRYARGANPGELYFVEEGLQMYLENPQKKLEEVLKGLRERMITELGGEDELDDFLIANKSGKLFEGLVSEDAGKRKRAIKKFMEKLDEKNSGSEELAYVNMAIALNSEIEPEKIVEVTKRHSQPYSRSSDMKKYVRTEETKGFLGLGKTTKYVVEPDLLERNQKREARKAEQQKSALNPKSASDGMVRPFEITPEDKGETSRGENEPPRRNNPNRKPDRRRGRNNSNPGDRD